MKNILVTGGAGFIGSHTVVELVNAGYRPIIVDNFSNSDRQVIDRLNEITGSDITSYENDYQDESFLRKLLKDHAVEGVIHFAAHKAVGESVQKPLDYYQNNVAGLITLLKAVEEASVKNFVFSSSCTVYGEPDDLPVTEEAPTKPATSPYGATKQMDETILQDTTKASKRLTSIALRYFNPIGAHPSALIGELPIGTPANLIPFITQTAAGIRPELTVHGDTYPTPDGTCIRDYIHVVDLAKAHVAALKWANGQKGSTYETCNIGTGKGSSVLEVITAFRQATGKKLPYKIGPPREGDIVATYAGSEKAKKLLGWKSEKSLHDALADAWRWQKTL
ncbi:MAG: UDP-glucose 4-epimerase GalE [Candidatus Saccharibacteria bacterium]|nr:UDP-glucose 4-epimerase GalE [Candidatus Saccharibacteria bacterium]